MRGIKLNLNMMGRRLTQSLLTALLVGAATVFLLLYPGIILAAEAELNEAYDSIQVQGWLMSAQGYEEPEIPLEVYDAIADSGLVKDRYAYAYADMTPVMLAIKQMAQTDESFAALPYGEKYKKLKQKYIGDLELYSGLSRMYGLNRADAEAAFARLAENVEWLPGYSKEMFSGDEAVCVYPADGTVALGDEVELIMRKANPNDEWSDLKREYVTFKVVGLHNMPMGEWECFAYCPLSALRQKLDEPVWGLCIRSFSFKAENSRDLNELKALLIELGLDRGSVRAALDDRILTGTISPIQKNIELLSGIHPLLYALVAAMGFFLCFLHSRARKREYAIMRLLGESKFAVMAKAIIEQLLLCSVGTGLGVGIAAVVARNAVVTGAKAAALTALCYCVGAALSALFTVRGDVMTILRDKE